MQLQSSSRYIMISKSDPSVVGMATDRSTAYMNGSYGYGSGITLGVLYSIMTLTVIIAGHLFHGHIRNRKVAIPLARY